jgi:hypothetical protein
MKISSLDKIYQNDPEKSSEGIPIDVGMNDDGTSITMYVAETNANTNKKFAKVTRKYERALQAARKNTERRKQLWAKIVAESVLVRWENVMQDDGTQLQPTVENKITVLLEYEDLMTEILAVANDKANYMPEEVIQETEKNFGKPSSGI